MPLAEVKPVENSFLFDQSKKFLKLGKTTICSYENKQISECLTAVLWKKEIEGANRN